ncbi:MAG: crotonase/enoyl-CoA hydratase family protein [Deltaproteobacteria bacterium]|nr:crotonase/enoyl-CoA hydratase family protein [Deltaproteobacteria bacterium]
MTYRCFDVNIDEKIAHIVLNRPEKRNSMIPEFWDELPRIVQDIDENARARVIVISSTGPHFSSGLDVNAFAGLAVQSDDPATEREARLQHGAKFHLIVQSMQRTFSSLESCRLPVIAAIQGGCVGGGVDLVTACDMRYATKDAFLTIYEINIGMTADVGTFPRIAKLIPEGVARELAYTGRRMPAAEAQSVGLVNRVFPDQEAMLEEVMGIAREIARKAPLAIYGCKRLINYARDHSTADTLDYVGVWNASMLQPDEIMEAMAANAQKRAGEFVDLPKTRGTKETP